tara:strand:- start:13702 stop:14433 length:732 start_codon:yes stop_codon:yes gene_type:complete
MAYVAPSTRSAGALITAAIWNADVVANPIAIYAGAMSVTSQAQYDLFYASSATQLARIAGVASGVLVTDGSKVPSISTTLPAVDGSALTGLTSAALTLVVADGGTNTGAGATNVDTIAISGLTALDTLLVFTVCGSVTQRTANTLLYNSTDSVALVSVSDEGNITAGEEVFGIAFIKQDHGVATEVKSASYGFDDAGNLLVKQTSSTFTTNWTGSWTLALRHGGVTGGGTFRFNWAVFKLAGQ